MITDEKKRVLDLFSRGRKLYKLMQFDEAQRFFDQALKVDPDDGPALLYQERCRNYQQNPPPDDWDGVYVMTTK